MAGKVSRATNDQCTPYGARLMLKWMNGLEVSTKTKIFQVLILFMTYVSYTSFHMTRKVISVVTPVLERGSGDQSAWPPFDQRDSQGTLIAVVDTVFVLSYASGMMFAGAIAERIDLRYFLVVGMTLSASFTALFGLGRYLHIHQFPFFLLVQMVSGVVQSSGWPAVMCLVGNWFGHHRRGLIFGLWNSHAPLGNILGSLVAGIWVDTDWAMSFLVPAAIMLAVSIICFFYVVPYPDMVHCNSPEYKWSHENDDDRNPLLEEKEKTAADLEESEESKKPAISFLAAIKMPGVMEYAMCLFFVKSVQNCFLYWLPSYLQSKANSSSQDAANMSTLFDIGGIIGGMLIGAISDAFSDRALVTAASIALAVPLMLIYDSSGINNLYSLSLLLLVGMTVSGPPTLITTAVSADLGTEKTLRHNSRALATVVSIIDSAGHFGSAIGLTLCFIMDYQKVFYLLVACDLVSLLFLTRLIIKSVKCLIGKWNCAPSSHN